MGSIKKQIFLSLGLLFVCSQLSAMSCPQTVGPVSITEGIFQVLLRVAQAQNVIQSQICALNPECTITVTGKTVDCSFAITVTEVTVLITTSTDCLCPCIQFGQSDIGAGGVYTISSPGVYCMYNDASFTTGPAITVNSSDVIIDMQGHTLDASNSANSGIVINGGMSNVTIKNGSIENLNQLTGVGGIIDDGSGIMMENIIIRDMNFNITSGTTSIAGINFGAAAVSDIFTNVLVENCQATNCFISLRSGLSAVVRGCVLTCGLTTGNASIFIRGRAGTNSLQNAVIKDCIVKNVLAPAFGVTGAAVFDVENALAVSINNCQSYGSTSQGVNIVNVVDIVVSDCLVQRAAQDAFSFSAAVPGFASFSSQVVVNRCVAQTTVAVAGIVSGFLFQTPGAAGFQTIVMNDCVAEDQGVGFLVSNSEIGKTVTPHFRNCTANNNAFGFAIGIGTDPATALIANGTLRDCIASNNSVYGFFIGLNVTNLDVVHCDATGNGVDGYNIDCHLSYFETYAAGNGSIGLNDLGAPGGANTYVSNRAHGNLVGDYAGVANTIAYPLVTFATYNIAG